jgi:low temperature requirement protein LtrA
VVPPVAARLALYAVPTCPFAREVVVIVSGCGAGEIVSVRVTVWVRAGLLESVTVNVRLTFVAVAVGVPVIVPVELNFSPTGKVPVVSDHVYGVVPPVATRVAL